MTGSRLIGLLGGTFDPIHYGHLLPARRAVQQLGLDSVLLIPLGQPPHRAKPVASAESRLHMVELACQEFPEFVIDQRELQRPGPSYSVDTLSSVREDNPTSRLCWIMGSDALQGFCQWSRWRQILNLAHLLVIERPGHKLQKDQQLDDVLSCHQVADFDDVRKQPAGCIYFADFAAPDISSTKIREQLQNAAAISGEVPQAVVDWLQMNPIYLSDNEPEICK